MYGEADKRYKALNFGAHRKPAPLCGAPSLTWHRAFWKNQEDRQLWYKNIDAFLLALYQQCSKLDKDVSGSNSKSDSKFNRASFQCPNVDKSQSKLYFFRHFSDLDQRDPSFHLERTPKGEQFLRYDVFSLRFDLWGISLTIRAELFRELWTLTCILDLDSAFQDNMTELDESSKEFKAEDNKKILEHSPRSSNSDLSAIAQEINEIQKFISDCFESHKQRNFVGPLIDNETSRFSRVRSVLVDTFSTFCDTYVFIPADLQASNKIGVSYDSPCGRKIAEFFGNVIGIQVKNDKAVPISTYVAAQPGVKKRLTIHALVGDNSYQHRDAHHLIDAAWPLIRELHSMNGSNAVNLVGRKQEISASLFQCRRSLYISTLGRLDPNQNYAAQKTEPVIFTIFTCNRSKWQIGRIIERMHNLGTCRVAALWNLENITDAGNKLHELRTGVDSAKVTPAEAAEKIAQIQAEVLDGGLSYRVERSRSYVAQIRNLVTTLRTERIEGFQPYDKFIQRRIFGTFDFIDRVGVLYSDLRSEISLQLDRQRTQQFMTLANNINSTTGAIREFTRTASDQQKTTNLLLDNAEFLIALPVFYYFGKIISDIFLDLAKITDFQFFEDYKTPPFLLSAVITFFLVSHFRRRHENARKVRAARE